MAMEGVDRPPVKVPQALARDPALNDFMQRLLRSVYQMWSAGVGGTGGGGDTITNVTNVTNLTQITEEVEGSLLAGLGALHAATRDSSSVLINRIDAVGDVRVTADGHLRACR